MAQAGRGRRPSTGQSPSTGRVKIRLASNDGVNVVEVEGPSSEAQALADSAIRLWRHLIATDPRNPLRDSLP